MSEGLWLWLTLLAIGSTTIMTRGSFILAGEKGRLPPALQRALRYAPAAALSALVMPDLLLDGGAFDPLNPKLARGSRDPGRAALAQSVAALHPRHGDAAVAAQGIRLVVRVEGKMPRPSGDGTRHRRAASAVGPDGPTA